MDEKPIIGWVTDNNKDFEKEYQEIVAKISQAREKKQYNTLQKIM